MKNFFRAKIRAGLKIIDQPWFYPFVLLFVGLAAYGYIFTRPGFYWDDWESVYLYYMHPTLSASLQYFGARPFSVLPYLILFPFAKMTPIVWQFVALILRWLGVLLIYYTLTAIWPHRVWQNKWIGVFLLVFPGFLSLPVSVSFSRQLMVFLFFACSLLFTVLAIKNRKLFWWYMPVSVVLGIAQIFMMEYFVPLEIIRPLVIWFTLRPQQGKKKAALLKTFLYWLPFAIGLGVYFWWRFFYIPTIIASDPNSPILIKTILSSPLSGLQTLFGMILQDSAHLLISVWTGTLTLDKFNLVNSKIAMIAWFLGIVAAVFFGLYIDKSSSGEREAEAHPFVQMLILGGIALMVGAIPVWATGRYIFAGKWSDRFTLGPMLGAVILFVYILDWLFRTRSQKQWLFVILLASTISLQVTNTNDFRLDWINQQELYWQLSWRIPNLKPGTAIIGAGTFTDKSSFYDGTYIVELLFDKNANADPRYGYFDIWHLPAESYQPNLPLVSAERGGQFTGDTSQAIGMYFNINKPAECVRILDPIYKGDPKFNEGISNIIPISNPNEITVGDGSRAPNPAIFGNEPSHGWCYFFEKADLARQLKDWPTIIKLGQQAQAENLSTSSGGEYLPFIEAYAQTGQWSKALELSLKAQSETAGLDPMLCNNWQRFAGIGSGGDRDTALAKAKLEFCQPTTK
jgi:hypothetical protein